MEKPSADNVLNKSKKKKIVVTVLIVLFALILVAVLFVVLYINSKLDKVNYTNGEATPAISVTLPPISSPTPFTVSGSEPDVSSSSESKINAAEKAIEDNLKNNSTDIKYDNDVFNILLIGCDSRQDENVGRSDSMILISINKKTRQIIMTSFLRDIYAHIPDVGNTRLNAAYAVGGEKLLMDTLEENFKIKVDKFISVNFFSFIKIIDDLGGVQISVTDDELPFLNNYVKDINNLEGFGFDDDLLLTAGNNLTLTGKQALGYSRIRYIGTDFQRTERQRTVLLNLINKLMQSDIFTINNILNEVLPNVSTNLTKGELYSIILSLADLRNYIIIQDRIPIDGSYSDVFIRGMEVLSIDFSANNEDLKNKIYG